LNPSLTHSDTGMGKRKGRNPLKQKGEEEGKGTFLPFGERVRKSPDISFFGWERKGGHFGRDRQVFRNVLGGGRVGGGKVFRRFLKERKNLIFLMP